MSLEGYVVARFEKLAEEQIRPTHLVVGGEEPSVLRIERFYLCGKTCKPNVCVRSGDRRKVSFPYSADTLFAYRSE